MANIRHLLSQVEGTGALFIAGEIRDVGGTPTLFNLSGPLANTNDVSVTDNSVGNTTLTIGNFAGPLGLVVPCLTVGSVTVTACRVVSSSYSGDTYSLNFALTLTSNGTVSDGNVFFQIFAF